MSIKWHACIAALIMAAPLPSDRRPDWPPPMRADVGGDFWAPRDGFRWSNGRPTKEKWIVREFPDCCTRYRTLLVCDDPDCPNCRDHVYENGKPPPPMERGWP